MFSELINNLRRLFGKDPVYPDAPGEFRLPRRGHEDDAEGYSGGLKGPWNKPTPLLSALQQAEAVISLPYATICVTPNYNVEAPGVIVTVAEILDQKSRIVNVSRCEMSARDAGRLARAMGAAADWANQAEGR